MPENDETAIKHSEVTSYSQSLAALRALPNGEAIIAENFLEADLEHALERFWSSAEWQTARQALAPKPDDRVLDYGAGRCVTSAAFARVGCRVMAVDISPHPESGLGILRQHAMFAQWPVQGVVGDGEHLMFPLDTFDIVYCRESLHHAYDLPLLARHLVRVLKPGGRFYATREHRHPWWSSEAEFRRRHPAVKFGANEHSYTESTYRRVFEQAGLRRVEVRAVVPTHDAAWDKAWHHRLAREFRRLPGAGAWLYAAYVRVWLYRSVGSLITLTGRK